MAVTVEKKQFYVEFEQMFDELAAGLKDIVKHRYSSVVLAIARTCKKLEVKQEEFIQKLRKVLQCVDKPHKFIVCVATLLPFDRFVNLKNVNSYTHGTLILELMLEFENPNIIITNILDMDISDLKTILCMDKTGSYVIEAFMKSDIVNEKSREILIKKLLGSYQELAGSFCGSFVLESLWNAAKLPQKIQIMEGLAYKSGGWANTKSGERIYSKFKVDTYKKKKSKWLKWIAKTEQKNY